MKNKVVVAGSINMDIVVSTNKHPKSGETLFGTDLKYFPGGKGANQAVSSSKLGADTIMIGKLGNDDFADTLLNFLNSENISTEISKTDSSPTGTALITVSTESGDNTIVVVPGANNDLSKEDFDTIQLNSKDVLLSQFEIPETTILSFFKTGKQNGCTTILNPAPAKEVSKSLLNLTDILVVNESEFEIIYKTSINVENLDEMNSKIEKLANKGQTVILTLGSRGAIGFKNGKAIMVEGRTVNALDTTGAGDCFTGALASSIVEGKSLHEAMHVANIAASISVTRNGAGPSMPTKKEVLQFLI